ncbi:MAG TPA: hypothetical protein VNQ76_15055 [Planctomicrobium sp.]|nr:hypothetical protein [Planctomicrobium sp.]
MKQIQLSFSVCCLALLLVTTAAYGQPESGTEATTAQKDTTFRNGAERTIYVPFTDLNATLGSPSAKIVLPYKSYRELLEQARANQSGQTGPAAILSSASYTVIAEEHIAQIQVTLKIEALRSGAQLPLQFGDAAIGSITAPEGVLLRGTGSGNYILSFQKAGAQEIQLKLAARVNQSPSGREIGLTTPISAVTELEVTVPQAEQTIEITPKGVPLSSEGESDKEKTRSKVILGSTPRIQIRWHAAASHAPEMNLLSSASNQTLVTIADGQVHTHSWLTYEILRGELSQVRVALPAGLRLLDVNSDSRIRNWKVEKQDAGQVVTIDLVQPATKQLKIELDAEQKLEGNELSLGGANGDGKTLGIHPLDVIRVSGQLAIRHGADLALNVDSQQGLVRIDGREAAQQLSGANALLFRFYTGDYSLGLSVRPVSPRINVVQQTVIQLRGDDLTFQETLQFHVERVGVFGLSMKLPDNVTIEAVTGRNVSGHSTQDGVLSIQLREQTLGDIPINIRGRQSLEEVKNTEFNLPIVAPENVEREEGRVLVFAKESLEVQTSLQSVQSAQPQPMDKVARQGDLLLNSVWSYSRRPVVIPVRIQQKPARLSAKVATTVEVQPEVSRVKSLLTYNVELAPLNTFRFDIPEAVSGRLQIEVVAGSGVAVPIQQKIASEPVDGRVVWTITTQRDFVGSQTFSVRYDAPTVLATGNETETEGTLFALPRPLGLVDGEGTVTTPLISLFGELSLEKDRTLSVTAKTGSSLEQIDNRELTLLPQNGTLAYRYFRDEPDHPANITIVSRKFEIQNVVSTIISQGLVEVVTSEDSQATYRCRYLVQSSERQRLLLALPENLEVLGIYVNDREVKLEKAEVALPENLKLFSPYWLNVNRSESSDSAFLLTFQFLWNIRPALGESQFGSGTLQLPLPVIDVQGSGVVQELKVIVWVPEKFALVGHPEPFRLQTVRRPLASILGRKPDRNAQAWGNEITSGRSAPNGIVQFPTEGRVPYLYSTLGSASQIEIRWWNKVAMSVLFSVAAALIGWILLATTWENRLGILLLFAFAAALYGLFDQASLYEAVSAGRYGLIVILGLWVLHALLGRPRERNTAKLNGANGSSKPNPPAAKESASPSKTLTLPPSPEDENPAPPQNPPAS